MPDILEPIVHNALFGAGILTLAVVILGLIGILIKYLGKSKNILHDTKPTILYFIQHPGLNF